MSLGPVLVALLPAMTYPLICVAYFSRVSQRQEELVGLIRGRPLNEYLNAYGPSTPAERFRASYNPRRYVLPVVLNVCTVSLIMAGFLCQRGYMPVDPQGLTSLLVQIPRTVMAAFVGAYLWCHYEMVRRSTTVDLTPAAMLALWLRLLLAGLLGYAASLAIKSPGDELVALAIGVVPISEMSNFAERMLRKRLGAERVEEKASDLLAIQGITPAVAERLCEENICTVQHLALADPVRLLLRTNFEWTVIVDWIDQALLYIYVGPKVAELRSAAIRGAIEVAVIRELTEGEAEQAQRGEALIEVMSETLGRKPDAVRALVDVLYNDPLVWFIWMIWNEMYGDRGAANDRSEVADAGRRKVVVPSPSPDGPSEPRAAAEEPSPR